MSKSKDLENIRNRPNSVHRSELVSLLEKHGFILRKASTGGQSGHDIYKHPDFPDLRPLSIPRHTKVPFYIVKQVVNAIDVIKDDGEETKEE